MLDEDTIHKNFPNINLFCSVSARTGDGILDLISKIKEIITKLDHIGDPLPVKWKNIRKILSEIKKNHISYSEYEEICKNERIDTQQAYYLSQYFHDLGVFLNFQDNLLLKQLVFLKPEWATNAVYLLIDSKNVQMKYGKFSYLDLFVAWNEYEEDKFIHLIELMKKFELCFQISDTNEYIIPQLLRAKKPDYNLPEENEYYWFEYKYNFMPKGIIERFIVRNHNSIYKKVYWKNGVVLNGEDSIAEIKNDIFQRKITIKVQGNNRKDFLAIIRNDINFIHKSLNLDDATEMIGCNCPNCIKSKDYAMYDYNMLKKYRKNGIDEIPCSKSFRKVRLDELLSQLSANITDTQWTINANHSQVNISSSIQSIKNRS